MNKPASFPKPVKLVAVGNSTGVVLPREMLARLRLDRGDTLFVVETAAGLELRLRNPKFEEQMAAAESVMKADRDVLYVLAK
jgi:putative addiction module antidote